MCGASSQQQGIFKQQSSAFNTMLSQAQAVFGNASSVFGDLFKTFSPIVAAGPNQAGFSGAQRTALNTQATEGTANAYAHAAKAVGEQSAAMGGGNAYVPSGASQQIQSEIAQSAAANEAEQKTKIVQADYETGRENYFQAAKGLESATGVFNPATEMNNASTNAGNSAANTADQIAQADNSWVSAVGGALGAIGGAAIGKIPTGGGKKGGT